MGKWCLHSSAFMFDQIIIKVASNQDRHKSSVEFDFGPNQNTHFWVTCPWVTKISHFWTWISLKPVGQSWSNFMFSIIGVGERLHKVLGQIDLDALDSGERSLPFGLLVPLLLASDLLSWSLFGSHLGCLSSLLSCLDRSPFCTLWWFYQDGLSGRQPLLPLLHLRQCHLQSGSW